MIPSELLYSLIGFVGLLLAQRLNIPWITPRPDRNQIRDILLDLLKTVSQPKTTPETELRQYLQQLLQRPNSNS